MKKKVNGRIVEIGNIALFEEAFKGLAVVRPVSSHTTDVIDSRQEFVNKCIEIYNETYKKIPFPFYGVESNVKYAMICEIIRSKIGEHIDAWINGSLFIRVTGTKALKFSSDTWGITSTDNIVRKDNTSLEEYKGELGYEEFKWTKENLEDTSNFYKVFMPDFVKACNGVDIILRWELSHMLDFGMTPEKTITKENRIIDTENNKEYMLDIYSSGIRQTGKEDIVINITGTGDPYRIKQRTERVYNFEVYEKQYLPEPDIDKKGISKMSKTHMEGMAAVFEMIAGYSKVHEGMDIKYTGVVLGDMIVYQVDNDIYVCRASKYAAPVEIAKKADIYGFSEKYIYLMKKSVCENGVNKESIFAFNPLTMQIRLCKIQFI